MTRQQLKEYNILTEEIKKIKKQLRNNDYSKNTDNCFSLLWRCSLLEKEIYTITQQRNIYTNKTRSSILIKNSIKSEPFLETLGFYRS